MTLTISSSFFTLSLRVIEARIALHPEGEVHFNLMALTSRSTYLTNQIVSLKEELNVIQSKGESSDWVSEQIQENEERLRSCQERFKKWDEENELRRHNFIGLVSSFSFPSSSSIVQFEREST